MQLLIRICIAKSEKTPKIVPTTKTDGQKNARKFATGTYSLATLFPKQIVNIHDPSQPRHRAHVNRSRGGLRPAHSPTKTCLQQARVNPKAHRDRRRRKRPRELRSVRPKPAAGPFPFSRDQASERPYIPPQYLGRNKWPEDTIRQHNKTTTQHIAKRSCGKWPTTTHHMAMSHMATKH